MTIRVDYAVLEQSNSQIKTISKGIEDRLDGLRARLARIEWEGSDRVAYEQHRAQWESAMQGINHVLHEIGAAVGVAREQYMATEQANARSWGA